MAEAENSRLQIRISTHTYARARTHTERERERERERAYSIHITTPMTQLRTESHANQWLASIYYFEPFSLCLLYVSTKDNVYPTFLVPFLPSPATFCQNSIYPFKWTQREREGGETDRQTHTSKYNIFKVWICIHLLSYDNLKGHGRNRNITINIIITDWSLYLALALVACQRVRWSSWNLLYWWMKHLTETDNTETQSHDLELWSTMCYLLHQPLHYSLWKPINRRQNFEGPFIYAKKIIRTITLR